MTKQLYIDYSSEKNACLKNERGISFEEVILAIDEGRVLDVIVHPNAKRYPNQEIFVIDIGEYVYLVPFVQDSEYIFLKTIFPSRKLTKIYLNK